LPEDMEDQWPEVWFGETGGQEDWRDYDDDDDADLDDDELPETPPDVEMMLGFDPLEEHDADTDTKLDAIVNLIEKR
jgi:hypothetical protein